VQRQPRRLHGPAEHRERHREQHQPRDEQERHAEHGQQRGHERDDAGVDLEQRQHAARQHMPPEPIEREGIKGGQVVEVVLQELRGVRREELTAHEHGGGREPEAEHERDDEGLREHRGMGR
jgi:hypothetical protein